MALSSNVVVAGYAWIRRRQILDNTTMGIFNQPHPSFLFCFCLTINGCDAERLLFLFWCLGVQGLGGTLIGYVNGTGNLIGSISAGDYWSYFSVLGLAFVIANKLSLVIPYFVIVVISIPSPMSFICSLLIDLCCTCVETNGMFVKFCSCPATYGKLGFWNKSTFVVYRNWSSVACINLYLTLERIIYFALFIFQHGNVFELYFNY